MNPIQNNLNTLALATAIAIDNTWNNRGLALFPKHNKNNTSCYTIKTPIGTFHIIARFDNESKLSLSVAHNGKRLTNTTFQAGFYIMESNPDLVTQEAHGHNKTIKDMMTGMAFDLLKKANVNPCHS